MTASYQITKHDLRFFKTQNEIKEKIMWGKYYSKALNFRSGGNINVAIKI